MGDRTTWRTILAALVAVTVLLTLAPGTASAQSRRVDDPEVDVTRVRDGAVILGPKVDWRFANISRTTVRHRRHRIVVRVDFHQLRRFERAPFRDGTSRAPFDIVQVRIQTDAAEGARVDFGPGYDAAMRLRFRGPSGGFYRTGVHRRDADDPGDEGRRVCNIKSRVNWRDDFIVMSAPRRCFGYPEWVRGAGGFWGRWEERDGSRSLWVSDDTRISRRAHRG